MAIIESLFRYLVIKKKLFPTRFALLGTGARFTRIRKGGLDLVKLSLAAPGAATIIEVGANSGQDTVKMLEAFPHAVVHCFEPDPRAIAEWRSSVKSQRARLHEMAISSKSGTVQFNQSTGSPPVPGPSMPARDWNLSGSILRPKNHLSQHPWVKFEKSLQVPCLSLDDFCTEIGLFTESDAQIDLIWADVQGAEQDLVLGGQKALERTRFFYTEYSNSELYDGQIGLSKLMRLLPSFEIREIWTNDVLFQNRKLN